MWNDLQWRYGIPDGLGGSAGSGGYYRQDSGNEVIDL